MRVLIVDFNSSGHHIEYLNHLVNYIQDSNNSSIYFYFLLGERKNYSFNEKSRMKIIYSDDDLFLSLNKRGPFAIMRNKFRHIHIIERAVEEFSIEKIHFMCLEENFNSLLFYRLKVRISGILIFSPFRIELRQGLLKYLIKIKCFILLFLSVFINRIEDIFILNDQKSVDFYNKVLFRKCFKFLPDPVNTLPSLLKKKDHQEKIAFSHLGGLSFYKGSDIVVEALRLLPIEYLNRAIFFFVGKASNNVAELIDKFREDFPTVEVYFISGFVSQEVLNECYSKSDYIISPHRNSEASSGIITHSLASGKFILAPNRGLMYDILKEYPGYISIKANSPKDLADKIKYSIDQGHPDSLFNSIFSTNFRNIKSSQLFAKTQIDEFV